MHEINRNRSLQYRAGHFGQEKKNTVRITHIDGKSIAKVKKSANMEKPRRFHLPEEPTQRRALRNLGVFFVMMILLTIISRGTADASLARITTTNATSGEIIESVRGTGKVSADGYIYVEAKEELTVKEVLATTGANLKAGEPLLQFDNDEINEKLELKNIELKEKQNQLDKLTHETPTDNTALEMARKTLSWAENDYAEVKENGNKQVSNAKQAMSNAKEELQAAKQHLEDVKTQAKSVPVTMIEDDISEPASEADNSGLIEEAQAAVELAEENLRSAETALIETENAAKENLKAAERAIETARNSLESMGISAAVQSQEKENQAKQDSVEAEAVRLELDKINGVIAWLNALKAENGIIKAEREGIVEALPETGDKSSADTALVTLADISGGFEAEMSVSDADAERLSLGGTADIVEQTGMYGSNRYEGKVLSISEPDESGMVKVKVSLPEGNFEQGDSLDIRLVCGSSNGSTILPLAAVRSDTAGHFVLVVDSKQTVLGSEEVLRKIPITVLSTGDTSVSVEGALSPNDDVVLSSRKPVGDGDRVRIEE